MKNIVSKEHTEQILRKMCEAVDVEYDSFDFKQDGWFWKHEWTEKQEGEFRVWLGKFFRKNKYVNKGKYRGQDAGEYKAGMFITNYGWRLEK